MELLAPYPRHYSWSKPRLFLPVLRQSFASQNRKEKSGQNNRWVLCEHTAKSQYNEQKNAEPSKHSVLRFLHTGYNYLVIIDGNMHL